MSDQITKPSDLAQDGSPSPVRRIINTLKWVWMLMVVVGVFVYGVNNFNDIWQQLSQLSLGAVVLSLTLLAIARFLLVLLTRDILKIMGYDVSVGAMFYINSTSDLAKYLPGGIWHFVGRAAYYKHISLSVKEVGQALIKENVWLVLSSFFFATITLIGAYRPDTMFWTFPTCFTAYLLTIYLTIRQSRFSTLLRVIMLQMLVWLCFGLSFSAILPLELTPAMLIIGAGGFTLSWLIGFLSLFAPGGIGVREIVLVTVLTPIVTNGISAPIVLAHRGLWIVMEVFFFLIAWVFFKVDR